MKDIVIIGAGGFAREVAWLIEEINKVDKQWNLLGFLEKGSEKVGELLNGYPVLGEDSWLQGKTDVWVTIAVGECKLKEKIYNNIKKYTDKFATLIHPNVALSKYVEIGEGSIICAGNIITVNIVIGKNVILNLDCTIGHDSSISDFSTLSPSVNISGNVFVDKGVSIGTGAAVIPGPRISEYSIIGAGAVVTKDIPANCIAVGAPAKPIKINE